MWGNIVGLGLRLVLKGFNVYSKVKEKIAKPPSNEEIDKEITTTLTMEEKRKKKEKEALAKIKSQ